MVPEFALKSIGRVGHAELDTYRNLSKGLAVLDRWRMAKASVDEVVRPYLKKVNFN